MSKQKALKTIYATAAFIALFLFAHMYHLSAVWLEDNKLQSPIVIRKPWTDRYVSPVGEPKVTPIRPTMAPKAVAKPKATPTPTPKKRALKIDLVRDVEASEIVIPDFDKIRILESGKGTAPVGHHRYCEQRGLWNEIGYGNRDGICFADIQEGKDMLERWYTKRANEGMTLAEALCYWEGQGKGVSSCVYSQRYFAL